MCVMFAVFSAAIVAVGVPVAFVVVGDAQSCVFSG